MAGTEPWRVLVAETLSGLIVAEVMPAKEPQFSRALSDKGSWTVTVPVHEASRVDLHDYTQSGKYSWLICYGEYIVQGGPVWTHQLDDESATLTITGAGIQSIFDKRVLRNSRGSQDDPVKGITNPSEDLVYRGLSLRGIAAAIVRDNMAQSGFQLPLDVPEPEAGQAERTYYGYDLAKVWERLDQLTGVINGPELDFAPYFVPGQNIVRWQLNIGGPRLGDPNTVAVWDYGAALGAINLDVDGSQSPAARAWVKGDGSEREMKTGYAADLSYVEQGFPPLDYVDGSHTSVIEQSTLEAYADRAIEQYATPPEQWSCVVRIDGQTHEREVSPALGNWRLGDVPTFYIDNHPWLTAGKYRRRVTGYANHNVNHVALTLEPAPSEGL